MSDGENAAAAEASANKRLDSTLLSDADLLSAADQMSMVAEVLCVCCYVPAHTQKRVSRRTTAESAPVARCTALCNNKLLYRQAG